MTELSDKNEREKSSVASKSLLVVTTPRGESVSVHFEGRGRQRTTRELATAIADVLGYTLDGTAFALAAESGVRGYEKPAPLYGAWELVGVGLNV